MMKHSNLTSAIRAGLCASLTFGTPALWAQDQDQDQDDTANLDRIEVTGSRIKRADIESASPVFVIQREEIERTGLTSVGDLLQDLPIAGSALNTQFNNGGNGETQLDLRNLGSNRLLVMLNGRRFTSNLTGVVDLNNIPVSVIKRVEVLKDGASAIYGSDAIAGVVNVITRDDFEGMQANAYFGQFESENDGEIQSYDFSVGTTSDRGSVFFSASYVKNESVFAGAREISKEPQFGTGTAFGSSGTPQGRFGAAVLGSFALTTNPGASSPGAPAFRPGDFSAGSPGDGQDRFNFAPDNYLLTPQERTNIFTQGTYDITDDIRMQVEASYNNRSSVQLLAPTPLFLGIFGSNLAANVGVGALNPFNPFGVALAASSWLLGRRLIEAGPRLFTQDVDSYRFALALEGSFDVADRYFDWDANYLYGKVRRSDINNGLINVQRVANGLSDDCVTGAIAGCVPLNVFGGIPNNQNPSAGDVGSITPDMVDYITFTAQDNIGNDIRSYTANLTGEIFDMPAGAFGFAAGYEHREEEGFDSPDAIVASGVTSGNSRQPTSGNFSVDEFYLELAVPLLSGVTGAERLDLGLAGRWSDYDTFGDTINGKVGLEWQPIDDLLVRATYSEGFRAPSIAELFAGQTDSFPTITDACSDMLGLIDPAAAQSQQTVTNCISQGVPADGSYVQANPQIRITVGSNPNLNPETSESLTFGLVYSPSWLDGLDITVDYYNIEIDNAISTVGAQTILSSCANSLIFCGLITRGSIGQVTDLLNAGVNVASLEVEGVDFLVSYSFPETDWGFFRVVWDGAYQGTNERFTPNFQDLTQPALRQSFLGFNRGDTAFARWKSSLDVNWSYGDWEATYGMQYIHGSGESCAIPAAFGFCNLDVDGDGVNESRRIGGLTYHDAQVSYHMSEWDTRVTFGVQNLWDKGPPISTTAFANSFNVSDYRVPGRFPYVRVTVDF